MESMDRTEVTTVGQLAKIAHQHFELRPREGTHLYYQALKDGSPQWVMDMIKIAHDGELPNDWRYDRVVDILVCIMNDMDDDRVQMFDPLATAEYLVDYDHHDLLKWLDVYRREGYLLEAEGDVWAQITMAQINCLEQMVSDVIGFLVLNPADVKVSETI
jgi:hypothetical protein